MRIAVLLAVTLALAAAASDLSSGFEHFYNLEYKQAISEFTRETEQAPEDPRGYNHLAQAILYREMHAAGALESELVSGNNPFLSRAKVLPSEAEQKRFDDAVARAIALCEKKLASDARDADALYAMGVARGVHANYSFLIRKQWREALREFTESRKLHAKAREVRPGWVDARMVEGVHDYVVGSLPFTWKMLGFLIGFRGDKDVGIRTVEEVAAKGEQNRYDAMILLAVAYRREKQWEKAVPLLEKLIARFPRNHLFRLELVQMFGDLGRKDDGLRVLDELSRQNNARVPPGKTEYARGNLLFWYREYEAALEQLRRAETAGLAPGVNTAADTQLRSGQTLDMLKRRTEAEAAYRKCIALAPDSDAAREARKFLGSPYRR